MVSKSVLIFLASSIFLLVVQKTKAVRVPPNMYMEENYRTRTRARPVFLVPRTFDEALSANMDNMAIHENMNAASQGELSSEIMQCANMLRNNLIHSGTSMRTIRNRGNIRKKSEVTALTVPACFCDSTPSPQPLGDDYIPSVLPNRKCVGSCAGSYNCRPVTYMVPVQRLLKPETEAAVYDSEAPVEENGGPSRVILNYITEEKNVTVLCACAANDLP